MVSSKVSDEFRVVHCAILVLQQEGPHLPSKSRRDWQPQPFSGSISINVSSGWVNKVITERAAVERLPQLVCQCYWHLDPPGPTAAIVHGMTIPLVHDRGALTICS